MAMLNNQRVPIFRFQRGAPRSSWAPRFGGRGNCSGALGCRCDLFGDDSWRVWRLWKQAFFRMFNGYRYGIYKKNLGVNPICSQDQMIICAPSSTFFLRDTCMCGLNSGWHWISDSGDPSKRRMIVILALWPPSLKDALRNYENALSRVQRHYEDKSLIAQLW